VHIHRNATSEACLQQQEQQQYKQQQPFGPAVRKQHTMSMLCMSCRSFTASMRLPSSKPSSKHISAQSAARVLVPDLFAVAVAGVYSSSSSLVLPS
jgi:hypothetical protein